MRVRLKEWRQRRLLTQDDLAKKSGVGSATIARIEAGQGARLSTLRKLAEALEITADQLLGEGEEGNAQAA
jgi:transcriptional regulator with XRE-family HTH domain